jgi:Fic family protein
MGSPSNFGAFSWMGNSPQKSSTSNPPSPSRHPRSPLSNAFAGLNLSSSSHPTLSQALKGSIRAAGFPNWRSISKATGGSRELQFTVRMNQGYRIYSPSDAPNLARDLFQEVQTDIIEIRKRSAKDPWISQLVSEELTQAMMELVFSSNQIERAGLQLDETLKICERIFRGEVVDASSIDERSQEYANALKALISRSEPADRNHVIRSRREIIQHALALQHIIQKVAFDNQPLSEALIRETHEILTQGIPVYHQDGNSTPSSAYGGKYRKVIVGASSTNFVHPNKIPVVMKKFIADYNMDLQRLEENSELDPFWLAAHYCNEFVNIHPFVDGNGRMCRLILNAILLKYAGVVISIGEHDAERKEYMDIAIRASTEMEGSGELALLVLKKATGRFRTLRKKILQGKGNKN